MYAGQINEAPRTNIGLKLIAGVFFTLLGILLTADNLDLIVADRYVRLWPAAVMIAGLIKVWEPGSMAVGVALIVVGGALLAVNVGLVRFSIFDMWPLILIGFGVLLVARALGVMPQPNVPEGIAIFANNVSAPSTPNYTGGSLTAIMGSHQVDLTAADITGSPAVLNLKAVMGGIEITVPDDWDVVSELTPVMAGVEMKGRRGSADPKRKLILRGFALMAGIEVTVVPRRPA